MELKIFFTLVAGVFTGGKWVYEYSEKLKWEKNKFLLEELKKFHDNETNQVAEIMLDWNGTHVTINEKTIYVDDKILYDALQTHDVKHKFSKDEFLIRGVFDEYFDNLTKLVFMSKAKLINKENLIMFLEYWFKILKGQRKSKSKEILSQINKYLVFYGYDELHKFISIEVK